MFGVRQKLMKLKANIISFYGFIFLSGSFSYRQKCFNKELVMTAVTVTVSVRMESSWVMPIYTESFLESNCNRGKGDSGRKAAQQQHSALTMSSKDFGVSPGFVSGI